MQLSRISLSQLKNCLVCCAYLRGDLRILASSNACPTEMSPTLEAMLVKLSLLANRIFCTIRKIARIC
jgi:hypothetical protein